jgi:hypothetical protein
MGLPCMYIELNYCRDSAILLSGWAHTIWGFKAHLVVKCLNGIPKTLTKWWSCHFFANIALKQRTLGSSLTVLLSIKSNFCHFHLAVRVAQWLERRAQRSDDH